MTESEDMECLKEECGYYQSFCCNGDDTGIDCCMKRDKASDDDILERIDREESITITGSGELLDLPDLDMEELF